MAEIRKGKGISQAELAERCKISRTAYTNIENHKRRPSPEVAQRIAFELGFEWTDFFPVKEAANDV